MPQQVAPPPQLVHVEQVAPQQLEVHFSAVCPSGVCCRARARLYMSAGYETRSQVYFQAHVHAGYRRRYLNAINALHVSACSVRVCVSDIGLI